MTTQQRSIFEQIPDPDPASQDGDTFNASLDGTRLNAQTQRVYEAMSDHQWRTLGEISILTGDPEPSISSRLRDLRKARFGSYEVGRRRRGDAKRGVWEFSVGAKGAGIPQERGSTPPPYEAALRLADELIPFLRHDGNCDIFLTFGQRAVCNCGMDRVRERYRGARQQARELGNN